jgi:amidase
MGSLIMPSDRSALYTIKPTLKIVPQEGIILVTPEADMAGPMAKSSLDLAIVLDAIVDPSKTTVPKDGYQSAVTGEWGDIRIGFVEPNHWLFPHKIVKYEKEASDQMVSSSFSNAYSSRVINNCFQAREWKAAYEKLATVVKVVKPVTLLSLDEATDRGKKDINDAFSEKILCATHPGLSGMDN